MLKSSSSRFMKFIGRMLLLIVSMFILLETAIPVHAQALSSSLTVLSSQSSPSPSTNSLAISALVAAGGAIVAAIVSALFIVYQARRTKMKETELIVQAEKQQREFLNRQEALQKTASRSILETSDTLDTLLSFQKSFEASRQMIQVAVGELSRVSSPLLNITETIKSLEKSVNEIKKQVNPTIDFKATELSARANYISQDAHSTVPADKLLVYQQVSKEYAHSLKTHLASIESAIKNINERFDIFLQEAGTTPKESKILHSFLDNAVFSLDEMKSILAHGAGFLINNVERFSIDTIVQKAIRLARTMTSNREEPFTSLNNLPEVKYYTGNLLWAIIPILDNAYDALIEDGKISIEGQYDASSNKVSILISNDGKPIPLETQHEMFKPGYTTKENGQGLGLCSARHALEAINGQVELVSPNGNPTTFEILFHPLEIY